MKRILIIGAGGHGKVVFEAISQQKDFVVAGFADAENPIGHKVMGEAAVVCRPESAEAALADCFVVAIGNNTIRQELFEKISRILPAVTIVHPSSTVSPTAVVGAGTVILAGAVINAGAVIGENTIINALVLVDHESVIGKHCHLRPATIVAANCNVKDGTTTQLGQPIDTGTKI